MNAKPMGMESQMCFFHLKMYSFLSERQTFKEKGEGEGVFHSSVHSQMAVNSQSWFNPKLGVRSFLGGLPCESGSKDLDHLLSLSQPRHRKLDQKWSIRDMNWHPFGMLTLAGGGLASWVTMLVPSGESYILCGLYFKLFFCYIWFLIIASCISTVLKNRRNVNASCTWLARERRSHLWVWSWLKY